MRKLPPTLAFALVAAGCSGGSSSSPATPPPASFDDSLHFTNAIELLGGESVSFGRGAAMVDFDQDGQLDLAVANAGMGNAFFRQLPDHTFEDVTAEWGVHANDKAHWGTIAADFDNDTDADVFFVNGGFKFTEPNQLLRNDLAQGGGFVDVSSSAGDVTKAAKSFSATALDHDNDGLLDLFVTDTNQNLPSVLLHNLGNLQFVNVASFVGIDAPRMSMGCSSGDFDNDGWVDIAAGSFIGSSQLLHNKGDGRFEDIAVSAGVAHQDINFGAVLDDFNGDGWLDLFIPKYNQSGQGQPSRLYLNNGDLTFADVTGAAEMQATTAMGHNTADLDGDGFPEVLIGTGSPADLGLDFVYKADFENLGFLDISDSSGLTSFGPTRGHGMAIGDLDQDGDVDIYASNGGPQDDPSTLQGNAVWLNDGNDSRWLAIGLEGVLSNCSAIGAHLAATTELGNVIHRYVRAGHGFGNTNSPIQHFGIGRDETVTRIDVLWPSGILQVLLDPEMSAETNIIETGLLLTLDEGDGSRQVELAGPAHANVELVLADATQEKPLVSGQLDAAGRLAYELGELLGFQPEAYEGLWLQAWIHDPDDPGDGTLTPRYDITSGQVLR